MNAEKARELSKKSSFKLLPKVYNEIKKAAEKGETRTFFYNLLSSYELDELKSKGFKVEQGSDKDGDLVTIDWSEKIIPERIRIED